MDTLRELDVVRAVPALTMRTAVGPHDTDSEDGEWDSSTNEGRLPSPMSLETARNFYAWYDEDAVDNGQINKEDGKLPHHFVDSDGTPGAASLNGVRNALSRLPQTDGISGSERDTIERHLRNHLPDDEDDEDDDEGNSHRPGGVTRAVDDAPSDPDALATMEVRFSPFGDWYEIDSIFEGRFLERTVRGAFAKTIRESRSQVKVLYDHGMDFQVGHKILGAVDDLREGDDSPLGVVSLFDTSYNRDLLPGLRAGSYGSSFRFRVMRDEWVDEPGRSAHNPDGIPERTIKEVRLFEFGPVTFPANPEATAGVRCLTDTYYERMRSRDPDRVDDLRQWARSKRTPDADAAHTGTSADGAAHSTDAPATGHPIGLTPYQRRARLYPELLQEVS